MRFSGFRIVNRAFFLKQFCNRIIIFFFLFFSLMPSLRIWEIGRGCINLKKQCIQTPIMPDYTDNTLLHLHKQFLGFFLKEYQWYSHTKIQKNMKCKDVSKCAGNKGKTHIFFFVVEQLKTIYFVCFFPCTLRGKTIHKLTFWGLGRASTNF